MYVEIKISLCHLHVSYNLRKFTKGRWENTQFDEIIDHLNENVEKLLIKIARCSSGKQSPHKMKVKMLLW